jgi:hypothetical protein
MSHPYVEELRKQLEQARDDLQEASYELGCHYLIEGCHYLIESWDRGQEWIDTCKLLTTTERTYRSEVKAIEAELALS